MPPQGESLGLALEDAVLFSRILDAYHDKPTAEIFKRYETIRKPRMDAAFDEANWRWESVKDVGWLANYMREWFTWLYLLFVAPHKDADFKYDVRKIDLEKAA